MVTYQIKCVKIKNVIKNDCIIINQKSKIMDHDLLSHISYSLCYVRSYINGHAVKIMLDSGAQTSVMSTSMVSLLNLNDKIDTRYQGKAYGVGTSKIVGCIVGLGFQINHIHVHNNFKVMDMGREIILLGMDFLTHHDCMLNIRNKKLIMDDNTISFLNESEIDQLHLPIRCELNTTLLRKILLNIIVNPDEAKYKSINADKLQVEDQVYLKNLGFVATNGKLNFTDNIETLSNALEMIC